VARRIDEEHAFSDFTTTDRTVYFPQVNDELSDEIFQLKTPVSEIGRREITARAF